MQQCVLYLVVTVLGDRADLIVVAQSMAAFVAPMLCERVDVRLLTLVAPMIPSPGESPGAWWSSTGQTTARRRQDEREGRDPDAAVTTASSRSSSCAGWLANA
jgi:hypothetical protein